MSTYEISLSLDEVVQIELGKALVLFNLIEGVLDDLLGVYLHMDGRGLDARVAHIISAELSFKQKVGQADSMLRLTADLAEQSKNDPHIANLPTTYAKLYEHWTAIRKHLCVAEDTRNSFIHSQWASADSGGRIEVKILEDGGGELRMVFGGSPAETDSSHVAVTSKTTAKQGKGLVYRQVPLTLEKVKEISVQFGLALNLLTMFRAYFYQNAKDDHHEVVEQMIAATPIGGT